MLQMKMNVEDYQMDHDDDTMNELMIHEIHSNDYLLDLIDVQEYLFHLGHHIHVDDDDDVDDLIVECLM